MNKFEKFPVVVLSTFGHTAADWLGNLLDSHKQILMTPALSYFRKFNLIKKKFIYENLSEKKIINLMLNEILKKSNFKSYNFLSKKNQNRKFKLLVYKYIKNSQEKNLEKKLFFAIHFAYAKIIKKNLKHIKIIVTHEHTAWNCKYYKEYFNSKFIFVIRDPRATFAGSFRTFDRYIHFPESYKMDIVLSFWVSAQKFISESNKKKIYIVKNEKINKNLKTEIKKLSRWLKIKYNRTLLKETHIGRKWHGDSSYLGKFELKKPLPKNYYQPDNVRKRWMGYLDSKTILAIETVSEKLMEKYNYKFENNLNLKKRVIGYMHLFTGYQDKKNIIGRLFFVTKNFLRRFLIIYFNKYATKILDIS